MKPLILISALVFSTGAYAQEWVSVGAATAVAPSSQAPLIDTSDQAEIISLPNNKRATGSLEAELAWQVEQLQQELASLRGLVEQQEHQLNQLQNESQQRYLDLDQRVSQLYQTKSAPVATAAGDAKAPSKTATESPEEAYQAAMQLVREKKYSQAIAAFNKFIEAHPKHELMGNALYWLGEVWLVEGNFTEALQQFKRVVTDFPEHNKAADASYKIGVTLYRQNNTVEAKQWFQKVVDQYSGKADATVNLAKSYLQRIN